MTRIRPYLLTCCCTASLLLASGRATQLRAETPGAEPAVQEAPCAALGGPFAAIPGGNGTIGREAGRAAGQGAVPPGAAPRPAQRSQHTFFANAAYTAVISTLYLAESTYRLAERRLRHQCRVQLDVAPGLRRRNRLLGRIHLGRTQRDPAHEPYPLHRAGVRRPAAGRAQMALPGKRGHRLRPLHPQLRRYIGQQGRRSIHESASVEFMLGRHIGLGAGISGQWLIVDSPDVDDGAELSLFGIFRFQFGGGLRVYF